MSPWLLWPRAVCAGALAFGLGVVGHVTADGLLPGRALLVALFVMSVVLSAPFLHRPAGRVRLIGLLIGGQVVVHLILTVAAGHRGVAGASSSALPVRPSGPVSLPTVDGHRVGSLQDAYQGMSGHPTSMAPALPVAHLIDDLSAHAPMMAVHLLAAALVGLWLARGERCLWDLLALTSRRILVATWALASIPAAIVVRRAMPAAPLLVPVALRQARPHPRRGPPVPVV